MKDLKKLLKKYDIESVEEFEPKFYTMNLVNGYKIERQAIKNLKKRYSKEELIQVENYDKIGIVEYVAKDQFYIKNNKIIVED